MKQEYCEWEDVGDSLYETDCGENFEVSNNGSLDENNFNFCIYCGKKIKRDKEVELYR